MAEVKIGPKDEHAGRMVMVDLAVEYREVLAVT